MKRRLFRVSVLVLVALVFGSDSAVRGQAPTFEVASIKPNTSADGKVLLQPLPGGRFVATNVTLRQLIREAYQLQDFQISSPSGWVDTGRFDVLAKADADGKGGAGRDSVVDRAERPTDN